MQSDLSPRSLTDQEFDGSRECEFDLASGYPLYVDGSVSRWLAHQSGVDDWRLSWPDWSMEDDVLLDARLRVAVATQLGVPSSSPILMTSSGSMALSIVAATAREILYTKRQSACLVTTSPSIDIVPGIFANHQIPIGAVIDLPLSGTGLTAAGAVVGAIERLSESVGVVVVLSSPENPTGANWGASELNRILEACRLTGGLLVLDHAFLLAGVHDFEIEAAWRCLPPGPWVALWDTGKTVSLNHDKLAFVVSGSNEVHIRMRSALQLVQFDVSRRLKLIFSGLLESGVFGDVVEGLRSRCRRNLHALEDFANSRDLDVLGFGAGSLALVEVHGGRTGATVYECARKAGVAIVRAEPFFHSDGFPPNIIRIALARDERMFSASLDRLADLQLWKSP